MGRKSTKEERYIARQKLSELADSFKEERTFYNKFYLVISSNRNIGFKNLIEILNQSFNSEFNKENIANNISYMNKYISSSKANELIYIINLALSIDKEDKEKILYYSARLNLIDQKKEKLKQTYEDRRTSVEIKNQEIHNNTFQECNNLMDKVLKGEELTKEEKEECSKNISFIKKYLKEFNQEKYVDFLIKYNNIEPISKQELEQLLELVKFFRINLQNNVLKFNLVDIDNEDEIEKVNKIKFAAEDTLDEATTSYPKRLYRWKKTRLDKEFKLYEKYQEILENLLETENFECHKLLTAYEKSIMSLDYEFIYDMYDRIKAIDEVYRFNIKGIKTINDTDYKKLKNNYKKIVLKKEQ